MAQTASFPLVFDGHNDTILNLAKTGRSFFARSADGHIDLPRADRAKNERPVFARLRMVS